jgi:hypothetical protein
MGPESFPAQFGQGKTGHSALTLQSLGPGKIARCQQLPGLDMQISVRQPGFPPQFRESKRFHLGQRGHDGQTGWCSQHFVDFPGIQQESLPAGTIKLRTVK